MLEPEICEAIRTKRVNDVFLPGFEIPAAVEPTTDLGAAVTGADIVLGVMPSAHARSTYTKILPHVKPETTFVSATKGLDHENLKRITEVIHEVCSTKFVPRVAALSGPSFAKEVAKGDPTAIVIASPDQELARMVQEEFRSEERRVGKECRL